MLVFSFKCFVKVKLIVIVSLLYVIHFESQGTNFHDTKIRQKIETIFSM